MARAKHDTLVDMADLRAAIGLMTRLPVHAHDTGRGGARAAWAWPLAGLCVAVPAALAAEAALRSGLPVAFAACLALAVQIVLTGAMHEDGLADSADGLWGGWTRERRLEIMKDSRIGTYGVLALVLSVAARLALLAAVIADGALWPAVLAAALMSRAPMVAAMAALPPARPDGLSRAVGRPGRATALMAVGIALVLALLLTGAAALAATLAIAATTLGIAALARAQIGGQTGDILGAVQQIAEIAALATFAAMP